MTPVVAGRSAGVKPSQRPLVMGILNATPDSFFDGGHHHSVDAAIAHGLRLVEDGADIIDVGGESSRPGAESVDLDEELGRVVPVVEGLARRVPEIRLSVDTVKPEVARAAVDVGATILNDVAGTLGALAGQLGVGWVAMHRQGVPSTMQDAPAYHDVVGDVLAWCVSAAEAATLDGAEEVWIDPGIGFGKTLEHNLALVGALEDFVATGYPVLLGASRKSMIGALAAHSDRRAGAAAPGGGVPAEDRLHGSLAVATWAAHHGAAIVRAHDVGATVAAMRIACEASGVVSGG